MLRRIATLLLLLTASATTHAQMVGTDIFLQGDYVEVGIAPNGAYGSGGNAPTGYHPRPDLGLTGGPMGFVSDPQKDGWSVSTPGFPDYFGDFFLPGTPQEGWDISVNGTRGLAWRGTGPTSFTGGLTGSNTGYTSTGSQVQGTWEGSLGNLSISQITTQKKSKLYFVTRVVLKNTGSTTLTNIYYNRSLDPEPDATVSGNYASDKRIIFQPGPISRNCLVVATGQSYATAYLGLGTKDCRAKCYITSTYTPDAPLNNVHAGNGGASGYIYNVNGFSAANTSMGVVFNVGSLAPGETTELAYAYILKQADLDSALEETAPLFSSDSVTYKPYTTFRVCPGKTIPVKIAGGNAYKWTWTPGTGLDADSLISSGSLPPAGGAYGDSVLITVNGPRMYTATGYSLCDTQILVFYVDTITFTVPPSVVSPVKYCQGDAADTLKATPAYGAQVFFSTSFGGVETSAPPVPLTTTPGTTTYYVRQQNAAGCYSQYTTINVQVIPKPAPPLVHDTIYCYGVTAAPVSAAGTAIQWYDAATGGTKYTAVPVPSTTASTTQSFFPQQTVDGCVSARAELKVDVSRIQAAFTTSKDSLCGPELLSLTNGTVNTLSGSSESFSSFWTLGDSDTSSIDNPVHSYTDKGLKHIGLVASNTHGCSDSITKNIYVAPKAEVSFTKTDSLICQGEAVDFKARATEGYYSLLWDFHDGDVQSRDALDVRKAFNTSGRFSVTFQAYYSICGMVETSQDMEVTGIPLVNLGPDTTICPGNGPLTLKNLQVGAMPRKYMWSTGDTTESLPVYNAGSYSLRVSERSCAASDSITVSTGCYLEIPNAFKPGDDNPSNAYFLPRNLLGKSITTFSMRIFDRWGVLLFESDNINGKGWDGNYHGTAQPVGVYVYQIRISFEDGKAESYNGNVTLLR
ncbi:gliding motility-associated C-terminal domain-containing protein [Rurimicrobium arvi]|uniref:PKD domain-containing protein n=1 Tax=Rurimicrobium arvi TaxID=2049916 RepID=A0ABP8MLV4_9BACT